MLSVKFLAHDGRETILGNVAYVTQDSDELGNRVIASLADGSTWQFGPLSPEPGHGASVYVMSETGSTVADYHLVPGKAEAWHRYLGDGGECHPISSRIAA